MTAKILKDADCFHPETFDELLDHAGQEAVDPRDKSRTVHPDNWNGTKTFEEAMHFARYGWNEGATRVQALYEGIYRVVGEKVKRTEVQYDVAGSMVDVGRFCDGDPECMIQFTENEVKGPGRVLTVSVNMATSGGTQSDTIFLRGAGVMALVDSLETSGYAVELRGVVALRSNGKTYKYSYPIKRHGEAMEVDRLAFIFCSPAMDRRINFAIEEHIQSFRDIGCCWSGYYSSPVEPSDDVKPDSSTIHIRALNSMYAKFQTEEAVTAWILEQLKQVGVEII